MKTMETRFVMLLLGLAALLQLQVTRRGRPQPLRAAQGRHGQDNDELSVANPSDDPERGDVPGWVMITLMSAVLVAALLALAGPALEAMFNQAMDKVGN
ncbi:hypothetical protein LFT44_12970 [Arthrobacter sp. FW306-05-C]|uniref:hypothetical protein n=1 Tax=Arthrobacter TaxID=1663 RepID=UPI001EF03921|nr:MULTISPECIES: hypothetical protein [Arthrobacter]MDP9985064.1 hypothetical protein [Arthrobacter oryzae]UKA65429.1 hypothetical protein LFT44_12970 [Arthrobacter sp. FW306-05-C]UKA69813.1 hypothetical protein LFT49_13740 [Arthrobacter sp. FW306-06-A]UKA74112.1 hypothetical protein LFT46_13115 [Arthrobacter sp. FW306-07-I]